MTTTHHSTITQGLEMGNVLTMYSGDDLTVVMYYAHPCVNYYY